MTSYKTTVHGGGHAYWRQDVVGAAGVAQMAAKEEQRREQLVMHFRRENLSTAGLRPMTLVAPPSLAHSVSVAPSLGIASGTSVVLT